MKRIITIILILFSLLYVNVVYAQIPSFFYETSYVYTHHASQVTALKYTSDYDVSDYSNIISSNYNDPPNEHLENFDYMQNNIIYVGTNMFVTTVAGAKISTLYNCHAFSLHYKGDYANVNLSNARWISDPTLYFTDGSLYEISLGNVQVNDIVVYINNGSYSHTGIVTAIPSSSTQTLENIWVRSKDGSLVLADHPAAWPFTYRKETTVTKFYRWNHSYEYTSNSAYSHTKECSICSENISESHLFIKKAIGYVCTLCGFVSKFEVVIQSDSTILYRYAFDDTDKYMTYDELCNYLVANKELIVLEEFISFSLEVKNDIHMNTEEQVIK